MTKLYLIVAEDDDGSNFDLFVEATDIEQAKELWLRHYHTNLQMVSSITSIFEVPALTGQPKSFKWFEEVPEVFQK